MARRSTVVTRTFTERGKKIIVSTDSVEYMEEQEELYGDSEEKDASKHSR